VRKGTPKPPERLSDEAGGWWVKIVEAWDLDDPAMLILESSLEAFDRMRAAQAVIARDGVTILDRWQQPKQHPATMVERDSRAALLRGLKALGLDLEPLHEKAGRPVGS
jgi:P27 family predicted phage terminase small subunit